MAKFMQPGTGAASFLALAAPLQARDAFDEEVMATARKREERAVEGRRQSMLRQVRRCDGNLYVDVFDGFASLTFGLRLSVSL